MGPGVAAIAVGVLALGAPASDDARAVSYRVRSETVGDAYQLLALPRPQPGSPEGQLPRRRVLNRRRIHHTLGLGVHDLLDAEDRHLSFVGLFRFDADFGLPDETVDERPLRRRERLSIQTAQLRARNLGGFVDLTLGRQLHADAIDYLHMDGVTATFRTPWHVGVEVQAGLEVDDDPAGLGASSFELDGVRRLEGTRLQPGAFEDRRKWVLGAALVTTGLWNTRARLGYRRILSDGEINQEMIGLEVYQRLADGLFLSGSGAWDLYNQTFAEIRARLRWRITDAWELDGRYARVHPTFDADSIFNVFGGRPFDRVASRLTWHLGAGRSLHAEGRVRQFRNESYADGELVAGPVETRPLGAGGSTGIVKRWGERGRLRFDAHLEGGYGGRQALLDLGGRWAIRPDVIALEGRITGIAFADELQEELQSIGIGYELGAEYRPGDFARIHVLLEHNLNRLQRSQLRLFVLADLDLWVGDEGAGGPLLGREAGRR